LPIFLLFIKIKRVLEGIKISEERELEELLKQREKILQEAAEFLKETAKKIEEIDKRIYHLKTKIGQKKGEIVQSVEDLKCNKHPNAKFVRIGEIESSILYAPKEKGKSKGLSIFACQECLKGKELNLKRIGRGFLPHDVSLAYECPKCGIVKGGFISKHYRSSEESWWALAGREGYHFHCRICDSLLGTYYWAYS